MSAVSGSAMLAVCICLGCAMVIAGCADRPGSASLVPGNSTGTAAPVQSGSRTDPSQLTWVSDPPAGSAGEALLSGAKALMNGVYVRAPGAPDYLPGSWSGQDANATRYVLHAEQASSVAWPPMGQEQVLWASTPGTSPQGWSATVVSSGLYRINGTPAPVHVNTDCSGLVTSLFAYADTRYTTTFTGWKTGSPVPVAGCFNPLGRCSEPNPLNYYDLFTTGRNGWFRNLTLAEMEPGDLIALAYTSHEGYSGHTMLVAAVSTGRDDPVSRTVIVIDETESPHSADTRNVTILAPGEMAGAGIGTGYARLAASRDGRLRFFWNLTTPEPEIGSVAIGRAL